MTDNNPFFEASNNPFDENSNAGENSYAPPPVPPHTPIVEPRTPPPDIKPTPAARPVSGAYEPPQYMPPHPTQPAPVPDQRASMPPAALQFQSVNFDERPGLPPAPAAPQFGQAAQVDFVVPRDNYPPQHPQEVNFADPSFSNAPPKEEEEKEEEATGCFGRFTKCCKWLRISYYQQFFDVTTIDVLWRMLRGVMPFGKNFFDVVAPHPDLYGPFWIAATVLFLLAITSNLASYWEYWKKDRADDWNYDFDKIVFAACAVYGYLVIVPVILWAVQRFAFKAGLTLVECWCVYGYTFSAYIVATVMCMMPFNWLQWLLVAIACVISTAVLVISLFPPLRKIKWQFWVPTLAVIVVLHLALAFTFKIYFFSIKVAPSSTSSSPQESSSPAAVSSTVGSSS